MRKTLTMLLASTLVLATLASASEPVLFDGCDSQGRSIPARQDAELTVLVRAVSDQGRPEIRYNPEILPRLSSNARLFFYAHQCARLGTGDGAAAARRADCVALNTLLDNAQLRYADLPALQAELQFSPAEWALLPGQPRDIDLSNCRPSSGDVLRLPPARQASPRQDAWNTCVRACADRLWSCRRAGRDGAGSQCQTAYDDCRSNCRE